MSESKRKYDSTVARMAGNIAAGIAGRSSVILRETPVEEIAEYAVKVARAIVAETIRTEPETP